MALKGDFAKLSKFRFALEELANGDVKAKLSDNLAEETIDLYKEGFSEERNPYGEKWKPKVFNDGRKVLSGKTNTLKRLFRFRVDSKGFHVGTNAAHAKYTLGTGMFGPRRQRIFPVHAKCLTFFAEGYVMANTRTKWAAGLSSSTSVKDAKASFRKNVSGASGSMQFRRSVAGSPQRLIFPIKRRGLPPAWVQAYKETTTEFLKSHLRGKRTKS